MLWPTSKALLRLAATRIRQPPGLPGYPGRLGEMGHLRRLGGRWSALGGAWPDPKGPGRCLPTPWVPWVRAVPIGPLRWPGGRSRAPESAVLPSGAVVGTRPVRPCTCTMRPTQVPELPMAGPHAPRGPTRSLGWARGGCFGLEGARGACFRSTRQIPLFSRAGGPPHHKRACCVALVTAKDRVGKRVAAAAQYKSEMEATVAAAGADSDGVDSI